MINGGLDNRPVVENKMGSNIYSENIINSIVPYDIKRENSVYNIKIQAHKIFMFGREVRLGKEHR